MAVFNKFKSISKNHLLIKVKQKKIEKINLSRSIIILDSIHLN